MGLIINMLDYKIINPFPDYLSYSLAKFAMEGFTRLSARYLAPRWRVCAVAPGYTFKAPDEDQQHFAETRDKVPLGRGPRPEDIGEAIIFLANAPTITGQTLYLDSGAHMMAQERDFSITN
jgi:NAD(P)-dependent dehydrogenase (short-subunit alcohol dehydrogenase family)